MRDFIEVGTIFLDGGTDENSLRRHAIAFKALSGAGHRPSVTASDDGRIIYLRVERALTPEGECTSCHRNMYPWQTWCRYCESSDTFAALDEAPV